MLPEDNPYISNTHDVSQVTQFCQRCGCHHDEIVLERLLCVWGENVLSLSHRRRLQIMEKQAAVTHA